MRVKFLNILIKYDTHHLENDLEEMLGSAQRILTCLGRLRMG